jgi:hypothetical protein
MIYRDKQKYIERGKELNKENENYRPPNDYGRNIMCEQNYDTPQIVTGDFCDMTSVGYFYYVDNSYTAYMRCRYVGTANCANCVRRTVQHSEKTYQYGSSQSCCEDVWVD